MAIWKMIRDDVNWIEKYYQLSNKKKLIPTITRPIIAPSTYKHGQCKQTDKTEVQRERKELPWSNSEYSTQDKENSSFQWCFLFYDPLPYSTSNKAPQRDSQA